MSRYIDADAAKKAMQKLEDDDFELYGCDIPEGFHADRAIEVIDNIPTADVQEVKHAKRIDGYYRQLCSNCKHRVYKTSNYCSYCGAKMDGDEE